jgi:hypothetical protein
MGKVDFDDLMGEQDYSGQKAYKQSKPADMMFTYNSQGASTDHRSRQTRYTPA